MLLDALMVSIDSVAKALLASGIVRIDTMQQDTNTDLNIFLHECYSSHYKVMFSPVFEEEVTEEDQIVFHMPPEQRAHIEKRIAEYDVRPPFDEKKCKEEYKESIEWNFQYKAENLPQEIVEQIADIRVFTLGYCTREVMLQLNKQNAENRREMERISKEFREVMMAQDISDEIHGRIQYHDCTVTELLTGDEVVIRFDNRGGFTNINKLTLVAPEIIKQDGGIVGSYWLYQELYRIDNGYELHVLFDGENMPELIVRCADILVEEE